MQMFIEWEGVSETKLRRLFITPIFRRIGFYDLSFLGSPIGKALSSAARSAGKVLPGLTLFDSDHLIDSPGELAYSEQIVYGSEKLEREVACLRDMESPLLPHELFIPKWLPDFLWSEEVSFSHGEVASFELWMGDLGAEGLIKSIPPMQYWRIFKKLPESYQQGGWIETKPDSLFFNLSIQMYPEAWIGFERYLCLAMLEVTLSVMNQVGARSATGYHQDDGGLILGAQIFRFLNNGRRWFDPDIYSPWHRNDRPPMRHPDPRLDRELDYYECWLKKEFPFAGDL